LDCLEQIKSFYHTSLGHTVGWGTALQTGRSRVRFPIDIILTAVLQPSGRFGI